MNKRLGVASVLFAGGLALTGNALASDAVVGALVGAGTGALVGRAVGGHDGAIIGSALGAAAGVAIASDHYRGYAPVGYAAPVYGPAYVPAPVYSAPPVVVPRTVYYQRPSPRVWREREWRRHEWRGHNWRRDQDWRRR